MIARSTHGVKFVLKLSGPRAIAIVVCVRVLCVFVCLCEYVFVFCVLMFSGIRFLTFSCVLKFQRADVFESGGVVVLCGGVSFSHVLSLQKPVIISPTKSLTNFGIRETLLCVFLKNNKSHALKQDVLFHRQSGFCILFVFSVLWHCGVVGSVASYVIGIRASLRGARWRSSSLKMTVALSAEHPHVEAHLVFAGTTHDSRVQS